MHIPSGIEIAHHFVDKYALNYIHAQSADGFDLVRDGNEYCYMWMKAYVDYDYLSCFLLDIRTYVDGEETRDFLFVANVFGRVICEWHNRPIAFSASTQDHRERFLAGMTWFAERIELQMETEIEH